MNEYLLTGPHMGAAKRACQVANDTGGTATASCRLSDPGLGATSSWSIAMYSAKVPIRR